MATKVVIKDVIGSYVYLREARENQNGEKDYSMHIILPKNHQQVEQIKKAITEVAKEHFGEKIKLSMLKIPLRDGDTEKENSPEYKNCYFFNAKAKKQPQIVNKYNEFASEKDLDDYCYSGATFCVSVNFYAFDKNGNRGVSAALNAVMLRKQTERIDGSVNAQAEFGEFAEKPAQGGDFGGLDDSEFADDGEDIDF